jgi:hypothetical protein
MKTSEFRKLIREEVKKVIKEVEYTPDYKHMKPFIQDLTQSIKTLQVLNDKIETAGPLSEEVVDALEILEGLYSKIRQAR